MIKILVSDAISEIGLRKLLDAEDVALDIKTGLSPEELKKIIGEYQGLLVRSQTKVTRDILEAATNLRVIGRAGVGVDNIDIDAATEHGIAVINAPDGNTVSTAEHSFAMLMSAARLIPQAHGDLKEGEWNRKKYVGVELNRKVLGIVGMGRIGAEVAKRAKAFNMEVIGYDPYLTEERAKQLGITLGSIEEVIKKADFITVHTPLTKDTKYIINDEAFAKMKKGVRIINCARGGIIQEEALFKALSDGIVAAAALDVYEEEPPRENHPLIHHPNVVTTPHLGASTEEAQLNVAIDVAEEIYHYLKEEPFRNAINLPSMPQEMQQHAQPYLKLSEKLGTIITNYIDGPIERVEIQFAGDFADKEIDLLARTVQKGILTKHLGKQGVNYVNAPILAKGRGIDIIESRTMKSHGFTNLLTVKVKTNLEEKYVSGTVLNGYGERVVNLNGFTVDLIPEGNIVMMDHVDQPGIIGKVGSILGNEQINIATMQVGRNKLGGKAVAFLGIDNPLTNKGLDSITEIEGVQNIYQVEL